jgi:hypothetical protein
VRLKYFDKLGGKKSNDNGIRTRDLPACGIFVYLNGMPTTLNEIRNI